MKKRGRWGSLWVREGGRLKKREGERRGSETDVPKLYTYNEYEHSVKGRDRQCFLGVLGVKSQSLKSESYNVHCNK